MKYKDYRIERSTLNSKWYQAYSLVDCDKPMIIAKTIEEIMETIDLKNEDNEESDI